MGNYEQLKQAVADVIKTNGNQEITGAIMQNTLLSIISTVGSNATFAGIATPTTNPGTPDQNVFYLASEPGIYINFGGVELIDQVIVLINKSGNWVKKDSGIATNAESLKLDSKFNLYKTAIFSDNLLNKNGSFIDGKYINGISGNKISLGTNSDYAISDFIPVKGGSKYLGTEVGEGGAYSAFFDKNLNAISLFKSNENPIAPENATWCRLSCLKSALYRAIFSERSKPFTEYIPYNDSFDVELLKRSLNNRFSVDLWELINGKLINVDGSVGSKDSYSASDFIPFNIKKGLFFKLQTSTNKYVSCIALYDENKQFVKSYSNIDTVVSEHIIKSEDIPDNVVYFRCTIEPGKGASLDPNVKSYKQYDNYVIYGEYTGYKKIKEVSNDVILLKNTNELSDENKTYSISALCEFAGIARSAYYKWLGHVNSDNDNLNERIADTITKIHDEHPDMGYRRIRDTLAHDYKIAVNDKRVLRICRKKKIQSYIKHRYNCCTKPASDPAYVAENILNREFKSDMINQKWVTDVSEFKYGVGEDDKKGKLYLSIILDLCDRRPVAFVYSTRNDNSLVFDTLIAGF